MHDVRTRLVPLAVLGLVVLLFLAPIDARGGEGDPPGNPPAQPGAKATQFKDRELGLTASGPSGWKMAKDKPQSSVWTRLVTWLDPKTGSDAILSRRRRKAGNVNELLARVRAEWNQTPALTVTGMRAVPSNAVSPVASVIVDATAIQTRKAKDPNAPPPPPVAYRISATYYLAPQAELLLYVKAKATHWSRVRGAVRELRASIRLDGAAAERGPRGEGAYRNDRHGFSCRYPTGYTVVNPARTFHVVQFEGLTAEQPVIGIYRIPWDAGVAKDVERMLTYYRDELAGAAETRSVQVGARAGTWMTAHATIGGREQTLYVVFLERGGEIWRLKASMSKAQEAAGKQVFSTFVRTFRLGAAPR